MQTTRPKSAARLVCATSALVCLGSTAHAQEPEQQSDETEGSAAEPAQTGYSQQELSEQGFVAAESVRPGDTVPGGALLVAAYALIWSLAILYVVLLARRHAQNVRKMAEISGRLDRLEAPVVEN
jgi:hypothetical protein